MNSLLTVNKSFNDQAVYQLYLSYDENQAVNIVPVHCRNSFGKWTIHKGV